jgi:hypothetical protein
MIVATGWIRQDLPPPSIRGPDSEVGVPVGPSRTSPGAAFVAVGVAPLGPACPGPWFSSFTRFARGALVLADLVGRPEALFFAFNTD